MPIWVRSRCFERQLRENDRLVAGSPTRQSTETVGPPATPILQTLVLNGQVGPPIWRSIDAGNIGIRLICCRASKASPPAHSERETLLARLDLVQPTLDLTRIVGVTRHRGGTQKWRQQTPFTGPIL